MRPATMRSVVLFVVVLALAIGVALWAIFEEREGPDAGESTPCRTSRHGSHENSSTRLGWRSRA